MWDFELFGQKVALIDEFGQQIDYCQLAKEGDKIADALGERCLVFVLCQNELGSVVGYSAFVNHRIVPVLLNADIERELLNNLLDIYKPAYLWLPDEKCDEFENAKVIMESYHYVLLKTEYEKNYELCEELCMLLTTSGSTGSPKFVKQSYENVSNNAQSIVQYLHLDETERPISTLPMNYTYGLSIINSHLTVGATILLTNKSVMQKEFWDFFKEKKATSFGGVPYTYEILDRLRFTRMNLPSLRYCTQAGGKLSPELQKKIATALHDNGKKFYVMYGQCEATARMGYLPAEKAIEKCGSIGISIPGGCFSLIDQNGNSIVTPYVTGELVYQGKNVTLGYAECGEDLLKGDERHGILATGDMAQFDDEGYYYIVGRRKRFLKIFGNRVNLDEIDCLVKQNFEGMEFASSGRDDHMFLFMTDETKAETVKAFIAKKTGLNPVAFQSVVITEIPKNDAGKILYGKLEEILCK